MVICMPCSSHRATHSAGYAPMSNLNPFRIIWNRHGRKQWDGILSACKRASLTHSSAYALAIHELQGMKADLGCDPIALP